jgi:hypothetical protein
VDQRNLLGHRDEFSRSDEAAVGLTPAQERLDACDPRERMRMIGW